MSSFGTSVINKSTKKFTPKVPTQRKGAAAPVTSRSQTPAPRAETPKPQTGSQAESQTGPQNASALGHWALATAPAQSEVVEVDNESQTELLDRQVQDVVSQTDSETQRPQKRRRVESGVVLGNVDQSIRPLGQSVASQPGQDEYQVTESRINASQESRNVESGTHSHSAFARAIQQDSNISSVSTDTQPATRLVLNKPVAATAITDPQQIEAPSAAGNLERQEGDTQPPTEEGQSGVSGIRLEERVTPSSQQDVSSPPITLQGNQTAVEARPQSVDEESVQTLVNAANAVAGVRIPHTQAEGGTQAFVNDASADNAQTTASATELTRQRSPNAVTSKANKPRQPRKKKNASDAEAQSQQDGNVDQPGLTSNPGKSRKPRKKNNVQSTATMAVEDQGDSAAPPEVPNTDAATEINQKRGKKRPQGRRGRALTPEAAEQHEHSTDKVTMFELCKDTRQGKKSQREKDLQSIDWTEVVKKRKQAEANARAGRVDEATREDQERQQEAEQRQQGDVRGPQLKLVNGQIVLDSQSLVSRRPAAGLNNVVGEEAIEESDLTRRITSQTWLYDSRRDPEERYPWAAKSDPWTEAQTEQFYDALRMFGTDFFIISQTFPGKSRRMIKQKFVREERTAPDRIRAALLGEQVPMDMKVFCALAGKDESDFKDPEQLEQELRELDEAQKTEIEQKKAEMAEKAKEKQEVARARAEAGKKRKKKDVPRGRSRRGTTANAESGEATQDVAAEA